MIFWNADRTTVGRDVFLERLEGILQNKEWILDENYISTLEHRLDACDTVFLLDYSTAICLEGAKERIGKPRTDLPWVETYEDREFMDYIESFREKIHPKMLRLLDKYSHKNIIVFHERAEAENYLGAFDI